LITGGAGFVGSHLVELLVSVSRTNPLNEEEQIVLSSGDIGRSVLDRHTRFGGTAYADHDPDGLDR
jgi:nucleoside-diphosphate-sugar epimerase